MVSTLLLQLQLCRWIDMRFPIFPCSQDPNLGGLCGNQAVFDNWTLESSAYDAFGTIGVI